MGLHLENPKESMNIYKLLELINSARLQHTKSVDKKINCVSICQ